jgi:kumamolisin
MKSFKTALVILLLVFASVPCAAAQKEALPYPKVSTPKAIDRGALTAQRETGPISVTVALGLREPEEAESLLRALHTPGNPQYHKFLTAEQFVARFAPTDAEVTKVVAGLAKYGLTAERTSATTLRVTGLPANVERAFAVTLHSYEVEARDDAPAYTFHAPLSDPKIPSEIAGSVAAVVGLDDRPRFRPMNKAALQTSPRAPLAAPLTSTGNAPGELTVTDFASLYDVNPLYSEGVTGKGRTLGIMTFASFTPSDAYAYWSALGLSVSHDRIRIVNVDGGPGAPSDASGSLETTLDVEQSGGIAPGAKVIVYQAPNTSQGFVDLFAAAVDANWAETLSISWGAWEWFYNYENSPVTDPTNGQTVSAIRATHELLVRAGIQGQTTFVASGDGGAYEVNHDLGCVGPSSTTVKGSCRLTLSVMYPASDTAITDAGGTTLPGTQEYCLNSACTPPYYVINIPHERVWGWDYLVGFCAAIGLNPVDCGIFPAGSGGGVSVFFQEPWYQYSLPGVQRSQPGQYFSYEGVLQYALPPYYPGRNVPDVSFNADPETGYVIYYTSSKTGFGIESFYGGTSFVAPQLNGVSALLGQYLHGSRIGLLNYSLYEIARNGWSYGSQKAPLHAITTGNNWFYYGQYPYSPAAGLGTMDVANFAKSLTDQF